MSAKKCPFCGSKFSLGSTLWFECNTHVRGGQSKTCKQLCELSDLKLKLASAEAQLTLYREKWEKLREWAESTPAVLQDVVSEMNRLDAEAKDGQR